MNFSKVLQYLRIQSRYLSKDVKSYAKQKNITLDGLSKNTKFKHLALGAGAVTALILARNTGFVRSSSTLADSILHRDALRSEYISSSSLGIQSEADLLGRVYDPVVGDLIRGQNYDQSKKLNKITTAGTAAHNRIAAAMINAGHAKKSEAYVEDYKNKVYGTIDVILNSGAPLEIKTVSAKEMQTISRPKKEHISQANFYALATNQPYAYIQYYSREDSQSPKTFTVQADPSLYANDIMRIRAVQQKYKGAISASPYMSGFRPSSSWFGEGINYSMPSVNMSKVQSQKMRLSNLPIASHMPYNEPRNHPNFSRAGF